MNEKIEILALEKDFVALTQAERNLVLSQMPQEAFEHLRGVLLVARKMDAEGLPPDRLRAQLLEKMRVQNQPDLMHRLLVARIPAWQAVAALFLVAATIWGLKPNAVTEKIVTEIQVRTDTVWHEKTIWRERVKWRERVVSPKKSVPEPIAFIPENIDSQQISLDFSNPKFSMPQVGTSLGDTPELMRFFTQGDK